MEGVILNPTDMLVSPLNDYWRKGKMFTTEKARNFNVGVIEHAGSDIDKEWVGKVIYYHDGMGTEMEIKGVGSYELITLHTKLVVRLDQTKENY